MTDWQQLESKYLFKTFNRVPVTLVRGSGARVWDDNGKEYLDFVGGWAVNNLGHCHPVVVSAVEEQVRTLIQASNQFYTIPQIQIAELLVQNSCFQRVFLSNSGTEANEGAVKLARKYGKLHKDGAYEVITTLGSFHGRTLAMVAATGQYKFQYQYVPLPDGFVNVKFNDFDEIKKATTERTCAIMLEPIQGEGGVNLPYENYLREIREWCDEKGLLLIFDEIQTGIGRTGTLFAYQWCGAEPDIMTLAKGLGSGLPIGAILARDNVSVFEPGDHGSTFGGNPLACAASYATLKFAIENNVPEKAEKTGRYFISLLEGLKKEFPSIVKEVRGRGLLVVLEFADNISHDILIACLENGLLVNGVQPNALRFMPPLIITQQDVDEAVGTLHNVLQIKRNHLRET